MSSKLSLRDGELCEPKQAFTIYPRRFHQKNVMEITGWTEGRYRENRERLKVQMMQRWSKSKDVNMDELQNHIPNIIGPYSQDQAWLDAACDKQYSHSAYEDRKYQRVLWYSKSSMYIKTKSPWAQPLSKVNLRPTKATQKASASSDTTSLERAYFPSSAVIETLESKSHQAIQDQVCTDAVTQAGPFVSRHPRQSSTSKAFIWDSAYLHTTRHGSEELQMIPLARLIPSGHELAVSYAYFEHETLLSNLVHFNVIQRGETDFRLTYQAGDQVFNLADNGQYLCALGDFSRQPRATDKGLQPMRVTLHRNLSNSGIMSTQSMKRDHTHFDDGTETSDYYSSDDSDSDTIEVSIPSQAFSKKRCMQHYRD